MGFRSSNEIAKRRPKADPTPKKTKGVDIMKDANGNMVAPPEAWAFRDRALKGTQPVKTTSAAIQGGTPYGGGAPYTPAGTASSSAPASYSQQVGVNPGGYTPTGSTGSPRQYGVGDNPYQGGGTAAPYGFTPQCLGMVYDNPELLAQQVLAGQGVDNWGMTQATADAVWPALYAFMMQSGGLGDMSDAATMNYIGDYLQQYVTPGGSMPDFRDLAASLLGGGDVGSSPLAAQLSGGTPQEQVKALATYMQAAGYGNNPLAQQAYKNALNYYGTQYLGGVAQGDPGAGSYADYLAGSPLARWIR